MKEIIDVSEDVNALKKELHDLFGDKDLVVVSLALGVAFGEAIDDADELKDVMINITNMAFRVQRSMACDEPSEERTIN